MITTKIAMAAAALVTFWAAPAIARTSGWDAIPLPSAMQQPLHEEEDAYIYGFFECHPDGLCKRIGRPFRSTVAECADAIRKIPLRGIATFECFRRRVDLWEPVR